MLRLEQFEEDLFLITVESEHVNFSGLFRQVEMPTENLVPSPDGMKLEVTWEE